jgi:hypothetical protein
MRALLLILAAVPLFAQEFRNANVVRGNDGAAALRSGGWVAWTISTERKLSFCCGSWKEKQCCGTCSLEGNQWWNSNDDDFGTVRTSTLLFAVRSRDGEIDKVRMFDAACGLDGGGKTIHFLGALTPAASLTLLENTPWHDDDEVIAAIALHPDDLAIPRLIQLARHDQRRDVRKHSLFWLGQKAGERATAELRRAVDEDEDADVKEHAVFAISQLPRDRAVPLLIDLAKTHRSPNVREKAIFWLTQTGDDRALELIEEILTK